MDFLNGKIRPMYLKYLAAAFGSAMITSVYSIVDTAMVGQYHGPQGTATLAVVAPVWNIIYSFGLLMGIGGSVIFSTKRGGEKHDGSENQYFTASVIGAVLLAALAWAGIMCFEAPILTFFGADEALLLLAEKYMRPIKYVFPLFLFNQMLAAFLRNDGNPGLATLGVLSGGIFNVFGGLRAHHSGQHLCTVLRLQRRAGRAADHVHELRRGKGRPHQGNTSPGAVDDGIFRRVLDGAQYGVPEFLHPRVYESDGGNSGNGPGHYPHLCGFLPAFAVQHFFNLLFPGDHEARSGLCRFRGPWPGYQRTADSCASGHRRRKRCLACHAGHGAGDGGLRGADHPQGHARAAGAEL